MTDVWTVTAVKDDSPSLELLNEGFHGTVGSVADLMELVEDGQFDTIVIRREELKADAE